jgi:hypothetical protein
MKTPSWIPKAFLVQGLALAGALAPPLPADAGICFIYSKEDECWCQCTTTQQGGVFCSRDNVGNDPYCFQCSYGPCEFY